MSILSEFFGFVFCCKVLLNHYLCGKLFGNMRKDITNVVFDFGGVIAPADLATVIDRFKALGFKNVEAASKVGLNAIQATNGEDWTEAVLRTLA